MPLGNPHTSVTASEYYSSGIPFVHSAINAGPYTFTFLYVTRAITVSCSTLNAGNLISFGDAGNTAIPLVLGTQRFEVRCKKIIITWAGGTINTVAEMSRVPAGTLAQHTQADFGVVVDGTP